MNGKWKAPIFGRGFCFEDGENQSKKPPQMRMATEIAVAINDDQRLSVPVFGLPCLYAAKRSPADAKQM